MTDQPTGGEPDTIQAGIGAQLAGLGRWLRDRLVVTPAPTDEVVPAEQYLDPGYLRDAVARARSIVVAVEGEPADADADLRVAVSRFTRQYSSALSIVALVGLANGVALDVRPANCRFIIRSNIPFLLVLDVDPDTVARCVERPTTLPAAGELLDTIGELRERVWRSLYADHLGPLFARVLQVTRVSPALVWSNAAEWVALTSDSADEYLDSATARPYVDDRRAILVAPELPGVAGPNPLSGLVGWDRVDDPRMPNGISVRRMCCVTYLLQDRLGRLCQNCPFLPLDERVALIQERHDVPMGTPGGPAERTSIERGLAKIGRRP